MAERLRDEQGKHHRGNFPPQCGLYEITYKARRKPKKGHCCKMRTVAQSTQQAVKNLQIRRQLTLDAMIQRYGIRTSKGTLSRILNGGSVSVETELEVCRALHIEPEIRQEVTVCPSCLANGVEAVHAAGDCHGKPVAAVVTLAPGETVRPVAKCQRQRKKGHRPLITSDAKWAAYQEWSRQWDAQEGQG